MGLTHSIEGVGLKVLATGIALAGLSEGIVSLLEDPLIPCVLGALGGELVRAFQSSDEETGWALGRWFIGVAAVIFGAVMAYYLHPALSWMPLVSPGLAKLIIGASGWVLFQRVAQLDWGGPVKALQTAAVDRMKAFINGSGKKG